MKNYETEHYVFYYLESSTAEQDILNIATEQEACFDYICKVLNVKPRFKIKYFLCETAEDVGRVYGDNEPCNGFSVVPDIIYAVYNKNVKCIGFHEDAHIISYTINRPDCPAIREGLAMYFDRKWWGIHNLDWCGYFLETNQYISVEELLDKERFFNVDDFVSYPIMGAFTDYLIATYGIAVYMQFYQQKNIMKAIKEVYKKTPKELNSEFVAYVRLFRIDNEIIKRMSDLIADIIYDNNALHPTAKNEK